MRKKGESIIDCIYFPKFDKFLENDEQTLQRMREIKVFHRCHVLLHSIDKALTDFQEHNKLNFFCRLKIGEDPNLDDRDAEIAVGAVVTKESGWLDFGMFSYSLSLILKSDKKNKGFSFCQKSCFIDEKTDEIKPRIIRKFHFDLDSNAREDIPLFHMQYGGKPGEFLENEHYCLESWLETPRIVFSPMCLSLLFDFALREFKTELGKEILGKGEWIKIVKDSEYNILLPYFKVCAKFFNETKYERMTFTNWHYSINE